MWVARVFPPARTESRAEALLSPSAQSGGSAADSTAARLGSGRGSSTARSSRAAAPWSGSEANARAASSSTAPSGAAANARHSGRHAWCSRLPPCHRHA